MNEGDLRERRLQASHCRQRVRAIGETDPHDAGLFGEGGERLARTETVDEPPAYADICRKSGNDLAFRIADKDVLAARQGAGGEKLHQSLRRRFRLICAVDWREGRARQGGSRFRRRVAFQGLGIVFGDRGQIRWRSCRFGLAKFKVGLIECRVEVMGDICGDQIETDDRIRDRALMRIIHEQSSSGSRACR